MHRVRVRAALLLIAALALGLAGCDLLATGREAHGTPYRVSTRWFEADRS